MTGTQAKEIVDPGESITEHYGCDGQFRYVESIDAAECDACGDWMGPTEVARVVCDD